MANPKQNKIRFTPMADRILVEINDAPTVTKSGLYIPQTVEKDPPTTGKVLCLGTGIVDKPFITKVGDTVMFSKYAGVDVKLGDVDKPYKVLREADLLGFV